MKSQRSYSSDTPFRDLLLNTLVGVFFLFVMSFLLISPYKEDISINLNAEYIVTLTWDNKSIDDLDIWMQDPFGNTLFFRSTPAGMMHLDRDDKGQDGDVIILPNGSVIKYEHNQEIVTIRGIVPGEWILNIHMYRKNDKEPTNVEVKMEKLNPKLKIMIYEKYILTTFWQEITVARFIMDSKGDITITDKLFKRLIKSKKKGKID